MIADPAAALADRDRLDADELARVRTEIEDRMPPGDAAGIELPAASLVASAT